MSTDETTLREALDKVAGGRLQSLRLADGIATVYDPEIPVNIYELGLIYDIDVDSASNVAIRMTLTAPPGPSAQGIPLDVERRVREVAGLNDVKVEVVWDPPWTKDRMSETAKLALGTFSSSMVQCLVSTPITGYRFLISTTLS